MCGDAVKVVLFAVPSAAGIGDRSAAYGLRHTSERITCRWLPLPSPSTPLKGTQRTEPDATMTRIGGGQPRQGDASRCRLVPVAAPQPGRVLSQARRSRPRPRPARAWSSCCRLRRRRLRPDDQRRPRPVRRTVGVCLGARPSSSDANVQASQGIKPVAIGFRDGQRRRSAAAICSPGRSADGGLLRDGVFAKQ